MKLIIMDLDNTLLRKDKSISDYTVKVLERCRKRGYLIAFATARAENAMLRFLQAIGPDAVISNGGATIRVNGEIIYRNLMPSEDVAMIIKMCRGFTDGQGLITAECDDGYYCNFHPDDIDRSSVYIYSDFDEFKTPAYKITAKLRNEKWGEEIVKACPDCTVIGFSGEDWRRFAAKDSNKATAMRILLRYLGIDLEDVIAFGDDYNDIEMLECTGTAVAVSNAIQAVKDVADFITDSNDDDGVAAFLEKKILI